MAKDTSEEKGLFQIFRGKNTKKEEVLSASALKEEADSVAVPQNTQQKPAKPKVEELVWKEVAVKTDWKEAKRLLLFVDATRMVAELLLEPPFSDSVQTETCTVEILHNVLKNAKITFGIDEQALENLLAKRQYSRRVRIARGKKAIDGKNGVVKELFPRVNVPKFETRADGTIDFKNMHIVNNVTEGTVICELQDPTLGEPGTTVYGEPVKPRSGMAAFIPRGENVDQESVSATEQRLVARMDGNLVFKKDRFCVEQTFRVAGNVDNSTGNINFTGNVIVSGDVYEGYEIRTAGDVTVYGMVEGASIYASGHIRLEKGINGMFKGILEAGKDITAKFIENCTARAGNNIQAESIINSKIECDGNIKATGRGIITGGKITAFGSIEAKVIGTRSFTLTMISLGITSSMMAERNEVRKQCRAVTEEFENLNKDIAYLEKQERENTITLERRKKLGEYQSKMNLVMFKKRRLEKRNEEIEETIKNVESSCLTCNILYPPARISIGNAILGVKETRESCRIYRDENGEVVIGSK
ncbi:MAG: FapA family protein [Oscillospiraceae bacterium]|nr:FapA family protein [Oscillospiraceae bacterium]